MAVVAFLREGSGLRPGRRTLWAVRWPAGPRSGGLGVAEEEVVAVRELEEDLAGEDITRGSGRGGQDRADVPQGCLLGGAVCPGRGRADEPLR